MSGLAALILLAGLAVSAMRPRPSAPTAWGYPISLTVH